MTDTPHATEPNDDSPAPPPPATIPAPAGRSHGRRHGRWVVVVLAGALAVVINAGVLLGTRIIGVWGPDSTAAVDVTVPSPTEPASPFAGTPAEDFAEGEAGIVPPEAEPIGEFTAEEVAEALELVRDALIAARLDPTVLVDHDLEPVLAVVATSHQLALRTAIEADELGFPTLIASGAALAPDPPRVDGRISYEFAIVGPPDAPILEIVTQFVWVYPFESALVVVRDELMWEARLGRPWGESSLGLWLSDVTFGAWGADCDAYQEGQLRPTRGPGANLTDEADVIFDPDRPLEPGGGC